VERVSAKVSTGIAPLDGLLGGWERGRITLLVGKTGVGKTTLLLSSAVAMCGEGDVIYVDCEGNFSGILAAGALQPPEGLRISSPASPDEQLKVVRSLETLGRLFISSRSAVIVDGIAFHYHPWIRGAEDDSARDAAQSWLESQLYSLSSLARRHNVPVIISSWPTSEPEVPGEEGTGIVGGFAASAFSRTILEMYFVSDTRRGIRVVKHQDPNLINRRVEISLEDLPLFRGERG